MTTALTTPITRTAGAADLPLSIMALHHPAIMADPYPFYSRLRTDDPVHWEPEPIKMWALTRYADIVAVLKDPRFSSERDWENGWLRWLPESTWDTARGVQQAYERQVLFRDAPDHTRLRRLMLAAFTPRVVEGMRPLVQSLVDEMLDAVAPAGKMDVIAGLAYPLPTTVIAALLGVPRADREQLKAWSNDLATTFDGDRNRPERSARAYEGVAALLDYLDDLVARRRREQPRDDLMQALIAASDAEGALSAAEVVANCALLLVAGHETTTNLIGNGLLALLHHPDQLTQLRQHPELMNSAVEELLRYDSSVQATARVAKQDIELGDRRITTGQTVILYLGAANRDPAQFPQPDRLDIRRAENRHLAFAHGPHFCLGAALARLEGQVAFTSVVRRWPRLTLATELVEWRDNALLRGLVSLPILLA
jgi:cytochrome P450